MILDGLMYQLFGDVHCQTIATENPGSDIFHELTEVYEGAKLSANNKKSSPKAGEKGSVYEKALDKDGNELITHDGSILFEIMCNYSSDYYL